MGRVWSVDAVAKNASTSFYGNIVALAESPLKEGLLFVGTDDGLIQVSEDGGADLAQDRAVPRRAGAVVRLARRRPRSTTSTRVYATFENHKKADFKPYVLKSTDLGRSWTAITGEPAGERPGLGDGRGPRRTATCSSSGTEFGVFFTIDGGAELGAAQGRACRRSA